jgi:hypothetical protein
MELCDKVIYPPSKIPWCSPLNLIFLAGSIEMGKAEPWQDWLCERIKGKTILNPRRKDWDSSWEQSVNNPKFNEQVNWELDGIEGADEVVFYFQPGTVSPITLLELGHRLALESNYLIQNTHVICPHGFWRKGNVDVICQRIGVKQYTSLDDYVAKCC